MKVLGVAAVNRDLIAIVDEPVEEYEEAVTDIKKFRELERIARDRPHFMRLGGSVINTVYILARCGIDVTVFGKIGVDLSRWVLTQLYRYNIKFSGVVSSYPTGRTVIFSGSHGKRRIYVYPGANDLVTLADLEVTGLRAHTQKVELVHTSTFVCSRGLDPVETQIEIMRGVRGGRSIMLGTLYTSMALRDERFRGLLMKLLDLAHIVFLSEAELRELRQLLGISSIADLARCFSNIELIFLTRGAESVEVARRDGSVLTFRPCTAKVIDTTGAGDAFAGGVLLGLLLEKSIPDCVKIGLACARACVMSVGGFGYRLPRRVLKLASHVARR